MYTKCMQKNVFFLYIYIKLRVRRRFLHTFYEPSTSKREYNCPHSILKFMHIKTYLYCGTAPANAKKFKWPAYADGSSNVCWSDCEGELANANTDNEQQRKIWLRWYHSLYSRGAGIITPFCLHGNFISVDAGRELLQKQITLAASTDGAPPSNWRIKIENIMYTHEWHYCSGRERAGGRPQFNLTSIVCQKPPRPRRWHTHSPARAAPRKADSAILIFHSPLPHNKRIF